MFMSSTPRGKRRYHQRRRAASRRALSPSTVVADLAAMASARSDAANGSDAASDDASDDDVVLVKKKQCIYYRGDIKEPFATRFCISLRELADDLRETSACITVYLRTDGGDVFCGLSMYEAIRHCCVPVHVVCDACVCSAGTLVLLGASKRLMYGTSVMLVHSLSHWVMGMQRPKELQQELQNAETLTEIMTAIYKRHTKLTKSALSNLYNTDLYLRADECKRLGFVDEVLA